METTVIDMAERILRDNGCRITSFLTQGETQYVIKRGKLSVSPSFYSIRDLCNWVVRAQARLKETQNGSC